MGEVALGLVWVLALRGGDGRPSQRRPVSFVLPFCFFFLFVKPEGPKAPTAVAAEGTRILRERRRAGAVSWDQI